jgi:hypothetical protein
LNSAPIDSTVNCRSVAASDKLRDRATWLFASALIAGERGNNTDAQINEITDLANEALAQAEEVDRRKAPDRRP